MALCFNKNPTPAGVTGGKDSVSIMFGGFRFFVVNYDYEKSITYDLSDYPLTNGYPFDIYGYSYEGIDYYDITSLNQNYLLEIEKLKKAFNVNPNSKFKAVGYMTDINPNPYIYDFVYVFCFDFNDIFQTSIIGTSEYTDLIRLQDSAFWNAVYEVSDTLVGGDGTKKDICYTEALYAPVNFVQDLGYGNYRNYHAGVGVLVFEFPSYYSVLVPRTVPALRNRDGGGTYLIATFDNYKVTKKILCCLAECFSITN